MFQIKDDSHLKAMNEMQKPGAMKEWFEKRKKNFLENQVDSMEIDFIVFATSVW